MRLHILFLIALVTFIPSARADDDDEPKGGPPEFKRLKFRSIGPGAGGRVSRSCGVAGDPLTYYAATAAGGVWKSVDGGIHWKPIFDEQPIASIGSIAVAPSDPNVVYVGSGEANIRGNVQPGNGIYKSTDAGKTWKQVWNQIGQIGTMIVHPDNADIAFAAVLGHAFGPNEERGVYRTRDGGKTWQRVLHVSSDAGASDVCFDPHNPRILFAGTWQTRRFPWNFTSGGPGSGLHVSRDGGDTWTQLIAPPDPEGPDAGKEAPKGKKYADGLPEGIWGKVCVAIAPSNSQRVYAMIEAEKGGLFRSDDGGDTWSLANSSHGIRQRPWYFSTFTIHPRNPDIVYFPQVPLIRTTDGGKTIKNVKGPHHGDHHDIWIDPKNPLRMIDSNDGGVDVTINGGDSWFAPPLPIAEFYHIGVDTSVPYRVMGTMQDIGTGSGPSNSLRGAGILLSDWHGIGGGETGFTVPDPSDPNIVYAGEYGGYISRYDRRTRQARNISIYPYDPSGHAAADLRYRFQWTAPILISPHDPKTLYHAANVLFRSTDSGEMWKPISGDLTRNDKSKQQWSGGPITGDNTGVEVYDTIYALAESPLKKNQLWAGSDDGLIHVTHDGGKKWTNVTPKGLPEWATVLCIEPSRFDARTAWVVVDNHRQDDYRPYLFKTTDGGATWKSLAAKLPPEVTLRVVREDPKRRNLLYLGTDRGLALSRDGGDTWTDLKMNLPTVAVTDLYVKDNDLVIGTSGRSIWIFDDLTPIRDWTAEFAAKELGLLPVQPAVRWRYHGSLEEGFPNGAAPNPPAGAIVYYYLKTKLKGDLTLEILDGKQAVIAKLTSKKEPEETPDEGGYTEEDEDSKKKPLPTVPGLHRVAWDLHRDGAKVIKGAKVDAGDPKIGPLVLPGEYQVRITVGGKTETATLQVLPDPRIRDIPEEALKKQQELLTKLSNDLTRVTKTVEQMRLVKKQIVAREELLQDDAKAKPLVAAGKEAIKKIDALEEKLHNPKAAVGYDILAQKGGAQLYSQLAALFATLQDADGPPTQGVREVYEEQARALKKLDGEWQTLLKGDLAKLNELAKSIEIPGLILPK